MIESASNFGCANRTTNGGHALRASNGNGELYRVDDRHLEGEFTLPSDAASELEPYYLEEAAIVIGELARDCVERGELEYPPDVSATLELATGLYDEHFAHEGFDRSMIIEMFIGALLESTKAKREESSTTNPASGRSDAPLKFDEAGYMEEVLGVLRDETKVGLAA